MILFSQQFLDFVSAPSSQSPSNDSKSPSSHKAESFDDRILPNTSNRTLCNLAILRNRRFYVLSRSRDIEITHVFDDPKSDLIIFAIFTAFSTIMETSSCGDVTIISPLTGIDWNTVRATSRSGACPQTERLRFPNDFLPKIVSPRRDNRTSPNHGVVFVFQ
jgi:hypothetical protein